MALKSKVSGYVRLSRINKPVGVMLLLWPTLGSLLIAADGRPSATLVSTFVLGAILMRAAGCAINDYADRDFDRDVERTRTRPVTTGEISPSGAVTFVVILFSFAAALALNLNNRARSLAVIAVLLAGSYPFTKRILAVPQCYLALTYSFGIPIAFAAVQDGVPPLAWGLMLANAFWVVAYDTAYAMADKEDDVRIGVRSSALTFGQFDVQAVMLCYVASLFCYLLVGVSLQFSGWYWAGWLLAVFCAIYHLLLIRRRNRVKCLTAFHHNQWLGFALFAGIAAHYLAANGLA
jgi:4-hydroxybenzoate polyprenyltransferase